MNRKTIIIFGLMLLTLLNCQQAGEGISPIGAIPEIPPKLNPYTNERLEIVCHVDLEQHNPLNAKDYYLDSGTGRHITLFDYVVLGHAYLTKDERGYVHLQKTQALQYVLDNNRAFLKPLREKGIKILIEIRSGNYAPSEDGIGLGLGTLDMAAIQELAVEFKHLVIRYGIDGYEFNDTGGGGKAYPPHTRYVKRFQKNEPLYPDSLFQDEQENYLSDTEIEAILWRDGGCNFSNLIYMVFENLKERNNVAADYGSDRNDSQFIEIKKTLLVRNSGHGGSLIAQIRDEYMPDAYSGASSEVVDNMTYLIQSTPNANNENHPYFYNESAGKNDGIYMDDRYGPLNLDLSSRLNTSQANTLAQWFVQVSGVPNRYGALYFSNLPPISTENLCEYMSIFTSKLGWSTKLYEGGGDHQKTW
jgi:hypothetical protein